MNKGFSLIELLLYVAIFAIVSGLFVGILLIATRVQLHETASGEISNQLNFVLQTIQKYVRESSLIEESGGDNDETDGITEKSYLKLRTKDSANDPVCVSQIENAIYITKGAQNPPDEFKCKAPVEGDKITTEKVLVPTNPVGLQFTGFSNNPGHDSVQIDFTLNYKTTNPQSQFAKRLRTAVGRASAATFDSALVPGSNNYYDVGGLNTKWKDGYFSGDVTIDKGLKVGPGGYLQFDKSGSGSALPASDCDENTEYGRFYLRTSGNPLTIFVCTPSGWRGANLTVTP